MYSYNFYGMATGGETGPGVEEAGGQALFPLPQRTPPESLRISSVPDGDQSGGFQAHGQRSQSNIILSVYFGFFFLF